MNKTWEQAEYDRLWAGEGYSAARLGYTRNFLAFMDAELPRATTSLRALEIGCGDGFFSSELVKRNCHVTGIDLSGTALAKARRNVPAAEFREHDLANPLPFEGGSFDVVWCSEVLEHLFAPLAVLREIERVLRPGGRLLATVPYHGLIKNVGIALFAFDRHYDPTYPHIRFYTRRTLAGLLHQANLRPTVVTTCGSGLGVRDWFVPTNILVAADKAGSTSLSE